MTNECAIRILPRISTFVCLHVRWDISHIYVLRRRRHTPKAIWNDCARIYQQKSFCFANGYCESPGARTL